jgi:hypothetical protein
MAWSANSHLELMIYALQRDDDAEVTLQLVGIREANWKKGGAFWAEV